VLNRNSGVTLVELMVVVAIAAVGATLAAPGLSQMLANYKVRGAAESILAGLNQARAEAVRRNSPVTFSLSANGSGWAVTQLSTSATIESRSNNDSPGATVVSSTPATSVTFLSTGLLQAGTQMGRVTVSTGMGGTNTRRIDIFGGGLIRMCDPAIAMANDPRRC
jgi:type IV fimbrial biogenesis protein FimT